MKNIQVTFIPDTDKDTYGPSSTAVTDEEGRYRLVCEDRARRPGAVVGSHRVTLLDLEVTAVSAAGHTPVGGTEDEAVKGKTKPQIGRNLTANGTKGGGKSRVGPEYKDVTKTPLKKDVQPGSQTIDLDVAEAGKSGTGRPGPGGPMRGR
jgi:hypothetical protein